MAIDAANLINSNVVYNTNNSLNTYNKAIQQQQLKAQAEQKALTEELSTVKADGIRQADIPLYNSKFQKWRDSAIQADKEIDPAKRMILQSEQSKNKNDLANTIIRSKEGSKRDDQFYGVLLDPKSRDRYAPETVTAAQNNRNLSVDDPKYISDYSKYQIITDTDDVANRVQKIDDSLYKRYGVIKDGKTTSEMYGRDKKFTTTRTREIPPEKQLESYKLGLANDNILKNAAIKEYPDQWNTLSKDDFINFAANQMVKQRQSFISADSDTHYESHEPQGSDGAPSSNPISVDIPYGQNGKYRVRLDNYVPVSIPNKNFAGSEFIDLKTGKTAGKLPSSSDYSIVGVSNAPFINKGSLKGSISQPNYAENNPNDIDLKPIIHVQKKATADSRAKDYFIPYDRLPENVKQSKQFRQATANFVPNQQQQQQQPQQQQPQQSKSNSSSSKFDPVAYFNQVMKNKK